MDKGYLADILFALKAELVRFRFWCLLLFLGTAFSLLSLGLIWPKHYSTSVILYADETNIIEPLLKGTAEVTKIDRSEQASEIIYTRSIMLAAAKGAGLIKDNADEAEQDRVIRQLRNGVLVQKEGKISHFLVRYTANDPDRAFEVLNSIVKVFVTDAARKKRDESVSAFNFIDSQVQMYKRQLESAEDKLKNFNAKNTDGTEEAVSGRISSLREEIDTLKISIDESQARINTIKQEIGSEGQYLQTKGQLDELKARRVALRAQLEQLLLSYQEGYPDIVSVRSQISDLDVAIEKLQLDGDVYSGGTEKVQNPLYEELRKQLSAAEVSLRTQNRRMESLKSLRGEEGLRQKRIAENQAQLSDLTRDYDVTKKQYEQMLERKETARLSMTLDIEGQGITYRIQEPASFPLSPSGLKFIHFAILGPLIGLLLPLGLLVAYVLLDPNLRSARILQSQLPAEVELIGTIPHFNTPIGDRLLKKDMILLVGSSILAMAVYVVIVVFWQLTKN
ncbi:MAG: chain length-determining protein [Gammaproteobacteria bacterium]|nr:MAG: chain length-determining protein [Gammaproteobacteria bacterium]